MSIVIPASDVQSTTLNGIITGRNTAITAAQNAGNHPLAAVHITEKAQAQLNLVLHLLSSGHLNASTVLANETYGT